MTLAWKLHGEPAMQFNAHVSYKGVPVLRLECHATTKRFASVLKAAPGESPAWRWAVCTSSRSIVILEQGHASTMSAAQLAAEDHARAVLGTLVYELGSGEPL